MGTDARVAYLFVRDDGSSTRWSLFFEREKKIDEVRWIIGLERMAGGECEGAAQVVVGLD